jgi:hypothetical protein
MKVKFFLILISLISFVNPGCKNIGDQQAGQKQNTIRVPSDFPDISAAVRNAKPGDIIILSPGTYIENSINIDKAITITSGWRMNNDMAVIDRTIIDAQDQILFNILASGAEISGLRIIKGDHTLNITANTTVKYNHFDDNLDALSFESGSGGYAGYNVITNDRDDGMDMDIGSNKNNIGSDIIVEHNTISNSHDDGIEIRLYSAPDQNIKYNIHHNTIAGSNNAGIQLISYDVYTGKVFNIHHNIIRNCKTALGCMEGSNTKEDLSGATKMDEIVWFYNNTAMGNQMGATGGNRVIAFNNIILNNAMGGFKRFGHSSVLKNNLFFKNGQPDLVEVSSSVLAGENIFSKDPLINEITLCPLTGSPCINAGLTKITIDGSTFMEVLPGDFTGEGPDIGAIEVK